MVLKTINYVKVTNINALVELGCHLSKKIICLNESYLKITQNTFYFMLKALFVLVLFKFLSWLCGYVKNGLKRMQRVFSRFVTSQTGQQIIIIQTLFNIWRSNGYQIMKLGSLIEYYVKIYILIYIFLKKTYTKCGK